MLRTSPQLAPELDQQLDAALERLAQAATEGLDDASRLAQLGPELATVLPCSRIYLVRLVGPLQSAVVTAVYQPAPDGLVAGTALEEPSPLLEVLQGSLEISVCSDTRLWYSGLEQALAQEQMYACVALAVRCRRQLAGALVLAGERPLAYGAEQVRILRRLAPELSLHLSPPADQPAAAFAPAEPEREQQLAEVCGSLAGQFQALLSCLLGGCEQLRAQPLPVEGQQVLRGMEARVVEGVQLVRALQQFAAQEPLEHVETVDLGELAAEVMVLAKPLWAQASAAGRRVEVRHARMPGARVSGSRRELREALLNVLFNALQALPRGGEVWLLEGRDGDSAYLEVTDYGVGMSAGVLARARDPFFTTQPGRRHGLGLSVAGGIARRHGGRLELRSARGEGTTVRLSFPSA
ncbi:MAG TPA: HAMP domain-containing sensor histidine kinase [Armatimonadota bacterium]|jgi:signal transduction histidine kinase